MNLVGLRNLFPFVAGSLLIGMTSAHEKAAQEPVNLYGDPHVGQEKAAPAEMERLVKALKSEDPESRLMAVRALGELGPNAKPVVPELIVALMDQGKGVADAAETALQEVGVAAIPDLLFVLEIGRDEVRIRILDILRELRHDGGKKVEDALIKTLRDPKDEVARRAVFALTFKSPRPIRAIPILLELAASDRNPIERRSSALGALGDYGQDAAIALPTLLRLVPDRSQHQYVRSAAVRSLALIAPKDENVLAELRRILKDSNEDSYVRTQAASALGLIGPAANVAIPELVHLLQETGGEQAEKNHQIRGTAIFALGELKPGKDFLKVFAAIARDKREDPNVRYSAAEQIDKMAMDESFVPTLIEFLKAEPADAADWDIARLFIGTLGRMGPAAKQALPVLRRIEARNAILHDASSKAIEKIKARQLYFPQK